jgi:hypothetical protein
LSPSNSTIYPDLDQVAADQSEKANCSEHKEDPTMEATYKEGEQLRMQQELIGKHEPEKLVPLKDGRGKCELGYVKENSMK